MDRLEKIVQVEYLVHRGAVLAGVFADAVVRIDDKEHNRRLDIGMGAITDLSEIHRRSSGTVVTDFRTAATVIRVESSEGTVGHRLRSARAFVGVAPSYAIVQQGEVDDMTTLNADALGVGLIGKFWNGSEVLVEPEARIRIPDLATWSFNERAYNRWISS